MDQGAKALRVTDVLTSQTPDDLQQIARVESLQPPVVLAAQRRESGRTEEDLTVNTPGEMHAEKGHTQIGNRIDQPSNRQPRRQAVIDTLERQHHVIPAHSTPFCHYVGMEAGGVDQESESVTLP